MSNKETAQEIFETGIANGDTRDTIIVTMVQKGCSLNSAQNWYKDFADKAGLTVARIGHKAEALEFIGGIKKLDLLDDKQRSKLKADLVEKFAVATSTANDYVKAYAKENGIELPTSGFGANPEDQAKIYAWIEGNPNCEKEAFKAFMEGEMGRGQGSIDETWRGIKLARHMAAKGVKFAA
jgi:hypothetical protein